MPNITTAQIKARLDLIDWAANSLPVMRIFSSVQTQGRERYPRIDIENKSKQNTQKNVLLDTEEQRFLIHVNYATKGDTTDEEANVGSIETLIANQLNGWVLDSNKINIENFDWDRQIVLKPRKHILSILTVFVTNVISQTGVGVTGKTITMDIGAISGLQVLGITGNEGRDSERKFDTVGAANNISGGKIGTQFYEYEYTPSRYATIDALIEAKQYISVTIHEGLDSTILNVKPVNQSQAVRYDGLKTITLQLELK